MKYTYCLVRLNEVQKRKTFYYIDDSNSIVVGDKVKVLFGYKNIIQEGTVEEVKIYDDNSAPYPPHKTKRIIEKINAFRNDEFMRCSNKKIGLYNDKKIIPFLEQPDTILPNSLNDIKAIIDELSDLSKLSIATKMGYAFQFDTYHLFFGSDTHKYQVCRLLDQDEINRFEHVYQVSLPEDYKNYLMTIGNGGYGFNSFGIYGLSLLKYNPEYELLKNEFTFMKDFDLDKIDVECEWDDCYNCPKNNICLSSSFIDGIEYETMRYQQGTLEIAYEGCDYHHRLIVSGPKKGSVWLDYGGAMDYMYNSFDHYIHSMLDKLLEPAINVYKKIINHRPLDEILYIPNFYDDIDRIKYVFGLLRIYDKNFNGELEVYKKELEEKIQKLQ